jgi:hypothetical protein
MTAVIEARSLRKVHGSGDAGWSRWPASTWRSATASSWP